MRARSRDRRVYLGSHPVLFAVLAATRRWPARRLGGTVLVHDRAAFTAALTRIPLDRTAEGTTGGAANRLAGDGLLFDQHGDAHRRARRGAADSLGAAAVTRLRPVWTEILDRGLKPLADGDTVDLVPLAAELAGTTTAALLGIAVDGPELAAAARAAAAAAAGAHLPGLARPGAGRRARAAADRLSALVAPGAGPDAGLATMLAVAAITTTVAALPRCAAWAADADLWGYARSPALVDELFRVTAPSPLLPRVAAAPGVLPGGSGGCPVRSGDRMLLVARHAVGAHRLDPDPAAPVAPQIAHLVFGAGRHACPGARLARAQLADLLLALAPLRPVVVRARVDRNAALPGWRTLTVRAAPA
ncbi:cytochrome P450 [Actinoplanes sp. NPDC049118]|uniref:cytochrome P450 n=1 Tax=Actinoplanes sp. NPDC049118 TaxID=3155769 RepID=UPI0033EE0F58